MRPLKRGVVNKRRSARGFCSDISRTKAPNIATGLMRGGWRL